MTDIQPLQLSFTVRGFDCGYGGPLRPLALADMLQEAASVHAVRLGVGADDMSAQGRTWMLSRLDIRVLRQPREGETILVRTWPAGFERLFAVRDFEIEGDEGQPIVVASYAYLVVDIAARRPLRAQNAVGTDLAVSRPRALPDARFTLDGFPAEDEFSPSFTERAAPRHIDHNGHVNNAHLLAWLCDAVPPAARGRGQLAGLRAEFRQEVLLGEDIVAMSAPMPGPEGGGIRHACLLSGNGGVRAAAETAWR